jgi:hypothetical protein
MAGSVPAPAQEEPDINLFFLAAGKDKRKAVDALKRIGDKWRDAYSGLIVDPARFMRPQRSTHPTARIRKRLLKFLKKKTGKTFGDDLKQWRRWLWSLPNSPHKDIFYFKAKLYAAVDPDMALFFRPGGKAAIRLDEIDWGGVKVNGIPPLDHPPVLTAHKAKYLRHRDVVMGLYINGEARAYPKRIIAWHEMVLDRLGGKDITLAYCTLCGAAIPYNSQCGGKKRRFGTSGLLYRSNKLMFDHGARSLWSALTGEPVIGPLVGKGLKLEVFPLVTTTWGEWKKRHPDTTVLSLKTGFTRDYREGAAYKDYFASKKLMFAVPQTDKRLKNKAVVLAMVLPGEGGKQTPLAIHSGFLKKRPVFHVEAAGKQLVIITTPAGANRVFDVGGVRFEKPPRSGRITDNRGRVWEIKEPYLQLAANPDFRLERFPAHQAFWFGWYAQYPGTQVIK